MIVNVVLLLIALLVFIAASIFWVRKKYNLSLICILIGGIVLRLVISSDPFLHIYDERYHALVAKHLLTDWTKPVLYAHPILPYDYKDWWGNHIWLSKPIVPFYMMALSMKVFGTSLFALRLPSILLSAISVFLTYRIGAALFGIRIALLATLLHAIHGTLIELCGGRISSDHTETIFLFFSQFFIYVSLLKKDKWWPALSGIILGLAFLSKWISAFLPMVVVMVLNVWDKKQLSARRWGSVVLPFVGIGAVWLAYIVTYFPTEATWTLKSVLGSIYDVDNTHTAGPLFYIDRSRVIFGELIYLPLILLLYDILYKKKDNGLRLLFCWIFIPILLLSLASAKRYTYLMVAAPGFFLLTAYYARYLYDQSRSQRKGYRYLLFAISVCLILMPIRYSIERLKLFTPHSPERLSTMPIAQIGIDPDINPATSIIIGDPYPIEMTFYTGISTYSHIPARGVLDSLRSEDYTILYRKDGELLPYRWTSR